MGIEDLIDECLVDLGSILHRAHGGERGSQIARDIADVRKRLEDVEAEIEE